MDGVFDYIAAVPVCLRNILPLTALQLRCALLL